MRPASTTPPADAVLPELHPNAPAPGTKVGSHYSKCFGCGDDVPGGLRVSTTVGEGLSVTTEFTVTENHQGAPGLAHGGLLALAFDEALGSLSWLIGAIAVTGRLETDYLQPVPVGTTLHIVAQIDGVAGRKVYTSAVGRLDGPEGEVAVRATAIFVRVDVEPLPGERPAGGRPGGRARPRADPRGARLRGQPLMPSSPQPVDVLLLRLDPALPVPAYAHPGDAGADLVTAVDAVLAPGERAVLPTGVAVALPDGYAAFVHPRSGLAARCGMALVNAPGTVDAGYRGEIKVIVVNLDPSERHRALPRRPDRAARHPEGRTRPLPRSRRAPGFPPRGQWIRFNRARHGNTGVDLARSPLGGRVSIVSPRSREDHRGTHVAPHGRDRLRVRPSVGAPKPRTVRPTVPRRAQRQKVASRGYPTPKSG